ncbi:terpene synthase family protein [Streptomyces sp. NBC_01320]|uniref:terpene synthase family protein n=1 Tax=Streptomyces sp. NBC_01320 TaxID=2903824 RepID=UPI002E165061|nr:terpene synthase family protein [Streptomyces sp. NBC_01320]
MTDVITRTAVCDDFFDSPAGDDPSFATAAVSALTSVSDTDREHAAPAGTESLPTATADLWARMREPMSPQWRAWAGHGWGRFLRSFLAEADARHATPLPGIPAFCDRLSCDPSERESAERYVAAMTYQTRVTYDWSLATVRNAIQATSGRRPEYLVPSGGVTQ